MSRNLGTNENRNGLTNELEAYLNIKVDDCLKSIEGMQNQGIDYETAKELAFDDLIPKEHSEPEDWEIEGAQEDEGQFDQIRARKRYRPDFMPC